jgi:hypothetical protein
VTTIVRSRAAVQDDALSSPLCRRWLLPFSVCGESGRPGTARLLGRAPQLLLQRFVTSKRQDKTYLVIRDYDQKESRHENVFRSLRRPLR